MLELQKTVEQLRKIREYYRVKINEALPMTPPMSIPLVVIAPNDFNALNSLLQTLVMQVNPFSTHLSQSLREIHSNLYINYNGCLYFNSFNFGALGRILNYLSSKDFICDFAKYITTPWEDINDSLSLLLEKASTAKNRLEYNQVGVTARELYILLAKKVYDKEMHSSVDEKKIGEADAKGMLEAYLTSKAQNGKVKKYAEAAVNLAETVTHIKTEDKERLNTLVVAVVTLVGLVNNIYKNNQN